MPELYDYTGAIIAYENGELDDVEIRELFQYLVDTGLAWQLQGSYGRMAVTLLRAGEITAPPRPCKECGRPCIPDNVESVHASCAGFREHIRNGGTLD